MSIRSNLKRCWEPPRRDLGFAPRRVSHGSSLEARLSGCPACNHLSVVTHYARSAESLCSGPPVGLCFMTSLSTTLFRDRMFPLRSREQSASCTARTHLETSHYITGSMRCRGYQHRSTFQSPCSPDGTSTRAYVLVSQNSRELAVSSI